MNKTFYSICRGFLKVFFATLCPLEVVGAENIPKDGPVMLCANHVCMLDPLAFAVTLDRPVRFMAKAEFFKNPAMRLVFDALGAIPVKRGEADMQSIRTCMKLLQEGCAFGIFPQGTRNPEGLHDPSKRKPMLTGAALLAQRGHAVIVPCLFPETFHLFHKNRLLIGKPIGPDSYDGKADSKTLALVTQEIEETIWGMQDQEK